MDKTVEVSQAVREAAEGLTRPIIGIENRTAQEAFDIMADRFRSFTRATRPIAVCVASDRRKLTPEYLAMSPLEKWETLTLHGLLGTDEPWISDMRETLRATQPEAALREALKQAGRLLMAIEDTVPIAKMAQGIILAALKDHRHG
jgi:hypothetical protein